jgi:uncharacterized protein (TIGR02996 family)
MTPSDVGFLQAILAEPGDDTHRLVYADWLEEHGDGRARYLRTEALLAALDEQDPQHAALEAELRTLREGLDRSWLGVAGKRYDLWLESYRPEYKIRTFKLVREVSRLNVKEAMDRVEAVTFRARPCLIECGSLRGELEQLRDSGADYLQVRIRPDPDPSLAGVLAWFRETRTALDPQWLPSEKAYDVYLESFDRRQWRAVNEALRAMTGQHLEPVARPRRAPCVLRSNVSREEVIRLRQLFGDPSLLGIFLARPPGRKDYTSRGQE